MYQTVMQKILKIHRCSYFLILCLLFSYLNLNNLRIFIYDSKYLPLLIVILLNIVVLFKIDFKMSNIFISIESCTKLTYDLLTLTEIEADNKTFAKYIKKHLKFIR